MSCPPPAAATAAHEGSFGMSSFCLPGPACQHGKKSGSSPGQYLQEPCCLGRARRPSWQTACSASAPRRGSTSLTRQRCTQCRSALRRRSVAGQQRRSEGRARQVPGSGVCQGGCGAACLGASMRPARGFGWSGRRCTHDSGCRAQQAVSPWRAPERECMRDSAAGRRAAGRHQPQL